MSNEQHYDEMDDFYCRDLTPLSETLTKLASDGNRYHYCFALRMDGVQASRWLIKPATGWIDKTHEDFFNYSWNIASRSIVGAFMSGGQSGFYNDKVFDKTTGLRVEHASMPYAGWMTGARDVSREKFENWFLSGAGLRAAYHTEGIVGKIAWCDKAWAIDKSKSMAVRIQAKCPGWREDDGSTPELGITGALV